MSMIKFKNKIKNKKHKIQTRKIKTSKIKLKACVYNFLQVCVFMHVCRQKYLQMPVNLYNKSQIKNKRINKK